MRIQKISKRVSAMVITAIVAISSITMLSMPIKATAKEIKENVSCNYYEFEKGSKYEISESTAGGKVSSEYGLFSITGNIKAIADVNGVAAYEVQDANVQMAYELNDVYVNSSYDEWHLIDDKSKTVDGMKLEKDILSGAIILQTSLTGDSWITDVIYTDIRGEESEYIGEFYTSRDIQQVNGCYYRIIVVYELNKETVVEKSITNWSGIDQEYKKCAEVYEFYLINSSENSEDAANPNAEPKKYLGNLVNTGKDNGYSGNVTIDKTDPHYGWDIGSFYVNGYTSDVVDAEGNIVFLKDVGDRVALWFQLNQDINCLDGKGNLSINEDINGFDQYFKIDETNFKHGTLIISYTDRTEKKQTSPIIYTDYLAANTRTGANTKVELFEEGDYEVALNYEIKDSKGTDTYTNYRIYFRFSIRNANGMIYLFDASRGTELANNAIVEDGFRVDTAKSRYLNIGVVRSVIKKGAGGYYTDERDNTAAKDGEIFSEEGIYTITVINQYSNNVPTTKVIYVGTNPVLKALALGYSLDEINGLISQGAELQEDGTLVMPKVEETLPEETVEPVTKPVEGTVEDASSVVEKTEEKSTETGNKEIVEVISDTVDEVEDGSSSMIVFGAVAVVLIIGLAIIGSKRFSKKANILESASEEVDK